MGGAGLTSAGACLVLEVHAKRLHREDVLLNISENLNQTRIMERKKEVEVLKEGRFIPELARIYNNSL